MWHILKPCTCSQGQVGESLQTQCSDTHQLEQSKSSHTQDRFYSNDKLTESYLSSLFGMISAPSDQTTPIQANISQDLRRSQRNSPFVAGSHNYARTSVLQGKVKGWQVKGRGSGRKWRGWSAKLDRSTSSWRILPCLPDEDLTGYSWTWPSWGTMHDGVCLAQMMPALPTQGSGSGFWPTPRTHELGRTTEGYGRGLAELVEGKKQISRWSTPDANMGARGTQPDWQPIRTSGQPAQYTINQAVRDKSYPTPTACMAKGTSENTLTRKDDKSRVNDRLDHRVFADERKIYPTPTVQDFKRRGPNSKQQGLSTIESPANGQLNPDWVEWLMGWVIGWSSLKPLESSEIRSWDTDPADLGEVPRVATGIEKRVDRLKAIGNGQVPAVAAMAFLILSEGKANEKRAI